MAVHQKPPMVATRAAQFTVLGVVIGEQQEKLEQALAPFEAETGIEVVL